MFSRICRNADFCQKCCRVSWRGRGGGARMACVTRSASTRRGVPPGGWGLLAAGTVAVAVGVAVLGWPTSWWRPGSASTRPGTAAELLVVVEAVGVIGWWQYTTASFVIVQAAAVAYAALGYPPSPAGYAGLAVTGAVAARAERAWVCYTALAVALGGVIAVEVVHRPASPLAGAANAAFVAVAWAAGAGIRLTAQRSAAVAEAARQAAAAQHEIHHRRTVEAQLQAAAELHDRVGHALAAALRQAEAAHVAGGERRALLLDRIEARIRESLIAVGDLVTTWDSDRRHQPAPADQPTPPGRPTVTAQTASLSALLGGWVATLAASGVHVTLSVEGANEHLAGPARRALTAAVDEALANFARHSNAHNVTIRVSFTPGEAKLQVEDPGPARHDTTGAASGLENLARHLQTVGGRLQAAPTGTGGYTLEATVPADNPLPPR